MEQPPPAHFCFRPRWPRVTHPSAGRGQTRLPLLWQLVLLCEVAVWVTGVATDVSAGKSAPEREASAVCPQGPKEMRPFRGTRMGLFLKAPCADEGPAAEPSRHEVRGHALTWSPVPGSRWASHAGPVPPSPSSQALPRARNPRAPRATLERGQSHVSHLPTMSGSHEGCQMQRDKWPGQTWVPVADPALTSCRDPGGLPDLVQPHFRH